MTRWSRLALAAGAVVLAVVLFVVLRPGDEDDDTDATPAAQTTTGDTTTEAGETETETETGETTTEEAPTATEPDSDAPRRIEIAVRGGQPVGGVKRPKVERDQRVVLVVRSDVSDHIHLHGYDLLADVAPGRPGRISFRADTQGRFELELEDRAVLIAELEVR